MSPNSKWHRDELFKTTRSEPSIFTFTDSKCFRLSISTSKPFFLPRTINSLVVSSAPRGTLKDVSCKKSIFFN